MSGPSPRTSQAAPPPASLHASVNAQPVLRKRLAHAMGAAAVLGALWYMGVRPLERAHAARVVEHQKTQSVLARAGDGGAADPEALTQVQRTREADLLAWTELSSDPSRIYESFNRIGKQTGAKIDRIDPAGTRQVTQAVTPTRRGAKAPPGPTVEVVSYRLGIQGTYAQIVDFIDACETQMGATKVASFRLASAQSPTEAANLLEATLETAHYDVTLPTSARAVKKDAAPAGDAR